MEGLPEGSVVNCIGTMPNGNQFVFFTHQNTTILMIKEKNKKWYPSSNEEKHIFSNIKIETMFEYSDGGTKIFMTEIGYFYFPFGEYVGYFGTNDDEKIPISYFRFKF